MNIEKWITRTLILGLTYFALQASGIVPAIIPAAVPAAFKIGNGTKFQVAANGAVSGDCATFDAGLNITGPGTGAGCGGTSRTFGPANPANSTPPTLASWTLTDPGGASTADVTGGVLLNHPSGNSIAQLTLAAPGASGSAFTITAHTSSNCPAGTNQPSSGLVMGDAGNARIVVWELVNNAGALQTRAAYWTDASTFSSVPVTASTNGWYTFWQRIVYQGSGGNFILQLSGTGSEAATWTTYGTVAANAFLTGNPARIGFYAYPQLTGASCKVVLDYWSVTQP